MANPTIISGPVAEIVSVAEARQQCKIDYNDDDQLLAALIKTARRDCEDVTWRTFINTTFDYTLSAWPASRAIKLPAPPLQSVTSVTYYDPDDSGTVFSSASYSVDTVAEPGQIVLKDGYSWPAATLRPVNGIVIRYVAGYGATPEDVPEPLRHAVRMLVGHLYDNRTAADATPGAILRAVPMAVESYLRTYRHYEN